MGSGVVPSLGASRLFLLLLASGEGVQLLMLVCVTNTVGATRNVMTLKKNT